MTPTTDQIDAGVSLIRILLTFLACIGIAELIGWAIAPLLDEEEDDL